MPNAISRNLPVLEPECLETLWQLFVNICRFWDNLNNVDQYKSRLESFVMNRIAFEPKYYLFYLNSTKLIQKLVTDKGEQEAYNYLFTDPAVNTAPVDSDLWIARQKVSNEFITLQMALGGFKAFGAVNYLGYFGGPNIPGQDPPYRPMEKKS